jgi:DNA-binding transcriptional LysR family regulator
MELRQLEYFIAVVEEANFTRAAERVHISQSGVSAQIRQLERELGATLIDRSGRTATPTPAGVAALEHARAALASADALRQAVDDVTELVRGRIVVGMIVGCTITPLFDALATFHRAYPGVEIALIEGNSDELIERIGVGDADIALIGAIGTPADLDTLTIVSERLVAAVAPDHPLASRERVALADIGRYPLVCLPQGTGIRAVFDQACNAIGTRPDIALQASAPDAIADLAIRGLGVAILSESMSAKHDGRLKALTIEDIEAPATLALIWKPTHSPALRELLIHTRAAFTHNPPAPSRNRQAKTPMRRKATVRGTRSRAPA